MWNIFRKNDKKKEAQEEKPTVESSEQIAENEPVIPEENGAETSETEASAAEALSQAIVDSVEAIPDEAPEQAQAFDAKQPEKKKKGLFSKLKDGLRKTRDTLFGGLFVESDERINDEFYDELEEAMIISDMGMNTTEKLLSLLRAKLKEDGIHKRSEARDILIGLLADNMRTDTEFPPDSSPAVILIVGVNGVGKTTSIGKLASMYKQDGRKVMLAAGDTFRAAAAEQLTIWAERAGVPIVKHNEGADPAAV
ncbi:MAG: signal recognition particle receptor subunit alpha, partial [Clostridia bacterium]|nr:signal recognition particle receptor subunit alpha [Clostridia bacterium]